MALPPLVSLPNSSAFNGRVFTVAGLDLVNFDYELVLVDVAGAEITPLVSTVGLGATPGIATPGAITAAQILALIDTTNSNVSVTLANGLLVFNAGSTTPAPAKGYQSTYTANFPDA